MGDWTNPDGQDFRWWRLTAGLGTAAAARYLRVAPRTIRHWESGAGPIPYAAYRLMKLRAGYALPEPGWEGWTLRKGVLWSPTNQPFDPGYMGYLSLVFRMADAFRKDALRLAKARAAGSARLSGLAAAGARPLAAPGCPAPPESDLEAANDAGREGGDFDRTEQHGPAVPVVASATPL